MVVKLLSAAVIGLKSKIIQVEVHFSRGKNRFYIVGLPDKACSESKERVSAVIRNFLGKRPPAGTITVNLAPADIQKSGTAFDLPIALAILANIGKLEKNINNKLFVGELGLDGKTRHTRGILPIAELVRREKIQNLILPYSNKEEAKVVPNIEITPVEDLKQAVNYLNGKKISYKKIQKKKEQIKPKINEKSKFDFSFVKGQESVKRAAEIATAGGHNLLLSGSPGSGKTFISRAISTILPKMTYEESIEVTTIYSVSGLLDKNIGIIKKRPFRKPHHTTSYAALIGGGAVPQPGEVTLAHRGILFLDEFTEFSNKSLEALRQPLEDNVVTISRARGSLTFPANIMLVSAMNPCKCGWLGDESRECTCLPRDIERYKRKISGPILDRIDMQIHVKKVDYKSLSSDKQQEASNKIRERVEKARKLQLMRYKKSNINLNSKMSQKEIRKFIKIPSKAKKLLRTAMETFNLSARSYFKVIKVARTIADLEDSNNIKTSHISESLSYRIENN